MSIISGFNQFINQHFGFNKFVFKKKETEFVKETKDNQDITLIFEAGDGITFENVASEKDQVQQVAIRLDGPLAIELMPADVKNSNLLDTKGTIKQDLLPENVKNILHIWLKEKEGIIDFTQAYLKETDTAAIDKNALNQTTLYIDDAHSYSCLWTGEKFQRVMAGEIYSNYFNEEDILDDVHLPIEMVKCYIIQEFKDDDGQHIEVADKLPPYQQASIDSQKYAPNEVGALYRYNDKYYLYIEKEEQRGYWPLVPEVEVPVKEYATYTYDGNDGGLIFKNIHTQN